MDATNKPVTTVQFANKAGSRTAPTVVQTSVDGVVSDFKEQDDGKVGLTTTTAASTELTSCWSNIAGQKTCQSRISSRT